MLRGRKIKQKMYYSPLRADYGLPGELRKLLGEGRIKAFRVGGEWRINPGDLLIYLDERTNR